MFLVTAVSGILQALVVIQVMPRGWHTEPVFWAGAFFWGVFGFFWHEIMCWFQKKNWWLGLALVSTIGVLALFAPKTGVDAFGQFLCWGPGSIATLAVRVILEEGIRKKPERS